MDIALRDKDYAEEVTTQCCRKLGLRAVSGISDQARKLSKYRPKNPETLPPPVIFAAKNSGLTTFLDIFVSRLEECSVYNTTNFQEIIEQIRQLDREEGITPSDWKNLVLDFIANNWDKLDALSRYELVSAWVRAGVLACKVILKLTVSKDELRRFGYTKET